MNNINSETDGGCCASRIFAKSPDDEICITGISGKFPSSDNIAEFEYNLYNKVRKQIIFKSY